MIFRVICGLLWAYSFVFPRSGVPFGTLAPSIGGQGQDQKWRQRTALQQQMVLALTLTLVLALVRNIIFSKVRVLVLNQPMINSLERPTKMIMYRIVIMLRTSWFYLGLFSQLFMFTPHVEVFHYILGRDSQCQNHPESSHQFSKL